MSDCWKVYNCLEDGGFQHTCYYY